MVSDFIENQVRALILKSHTAGGSIISLT